VHSSPFLDFFFVLKLVVDGSGVGRVRDVKHGFVVRAVIAIDNWSGMIGICLEAQLHAAGTP